MGGKVWICKGEVFDRAEAESGAAEAAAPQGDDEAAEPAAG